MTRVTVSDGGADEEVRPDVENSKPQEPQDQAPARASILGTVAARLSSVRARETEVYPVGAQDRVLLLCRYRALGDEEIKRLLQHANREAALREKIGKPLSDIEIQNRQAALMLSTACEALVWVDDDGDQVDLDVFLRRPEHGMADAPTGPLRYTMESLRMLMPDRVDRLVAKVRDDGREKPSSVDVAAEMHRWGDGENHAPLRARGNDLQVWCADVSAKTLRSALGG